ncbi:MBL fold metallo-hydrolase [Pedobacter frigidisoli]|nr:MBL fold metallo-hydrolase [Pedobacter frigidisoli]
MKKSPNFKDGIFHNLNHTPELTEGYSLLGVIYDKLFGYHPRLSPVDSIPSQKVNLLNLPIDSNVLVWFGHSSYFIQLDGKRILVDPVFSGNASPIPGTVKAFKGTDRYKVEDLPNIDYLIISHDHYDHVDYETLIKLKAKTKKVICGLGVGADFEEWGYKPADILEKDWNETIDLGSGFYIHTTPARHFSGRGFTRNNTLWMSYIFQSPTKKIFIGGDGGYDTHFAEIGKKFGTIDLAILEDGQYDVKWKYIHLLPAQVLMAAKDLNAKRLFPVHSSKFVLANHPWDEPLAKITELNQVQKMPLVTPMIGELVNLKNDKQVFKQWWIGVK